MWTSLDGQHRNQTVYILCSQRWRSSIQSAKTRLGTDCGSDHTVHTVHGVLKARILKWFAIPFSSGPHFVGTLHHDPSVLGGPHGVAHSFTELHKPVHHDKAVIREGGIMGWGRNKLGVWDGQIYIIVYKTEKQEGPTV